MIDSSQTRHITYRPDIDGLRAIAVGAVVAFHAFPTLIPGGFVGVDVFFTISGYLISTIIFKSLQAGKFDLVDFYARRIRRIFPALLLVLVTTLAMGWMLLFSEEYRRLGKHAGASAAFVSNLFFWHESGYFDANADLKPLLHLWSLGIEEQFYLVWPLLLAAVWKRGFATGFLLALVCAASFILSVWLTGSDPVAAFYSPLSRCWELGTGALLAYLVFLRAGAPLALSSSAANSLSMAGLLLIGLSVYLLDRASTFPGYTAAPSVIGTALVIAAGPSAWANRTILSQRFVVAVGLISFPLYLWHWPLLSFLQIIDGDLAPAAGRFATVVLSLLLATATYLLIEKRVRLRPARALTVQLSAGMLVVFALSGTIYLDYGVPQRSINASFDHVSVQDFFLSRQSDDSCKKELGMAVVSEEVCLTSSSHPKTVFVGDSHAMALYSAIFAKQVNQDAMLISGHSCDLYPNVIYNATFRLPWGNNCTVIAQKVIDVASSLPSVSTVVIANKPPDFDAPLLNALFENGHSIDRRTAFRDGNAAMISALIDRGKRVLYITGVPIFRNAPADCEKRLSFVQPRSCEISKAEVLARRADYLAEVARLKATFPSMEVVDGVDALCPTDLCEAKQDGHYLYEDEQHLSVYGSSKMLKHIVSSALLR